MWGGRQEIKLQVTTSLVCRFLPDKEKFKLKKHPNSHINVWICMKIEISSEVVFDFCGFLNEYINVELRHF
jgi:hypothetical protein